MSTEIRTDIIGECHDPSSLEPYEPDPSDLRTGDVTFIRRCRNYYRTWSANGLGFAGQHRRDGDGDCFPGDRVGPTGGPTVGTPSIRLSRSGTIATAA